MKKILHTLGLFVLLSVGLLQAQDNSGGTPTLLAKVTDWFNQFDDFLGRSINLSPGELQTLPIGLRSTIGNTTYDLLVTDAVFGAENTEVSLYLRISGPDWQGEERKMFFGTEKVLISKTGGFIGDVKLALMGNITLKGKGDMWHLHFLGRDEEGDHDVAADGLPPTYAVVNCNGFKELQISAKVELNETHLVAIKDGKPSNEPLSFSFFYTANALDDILVKVNLPEFALRSVPDWTFLAEETIFDFSQTRNAPGFEGYTTLSNADKQVDFGDIWQGFYMKKIRLQFPDYIARRDNVRPAIAIDELYIDEKGFSGKVQAQDVLRLEDGILGDWGFSIHKFEMQFTQNKLTGGGMEGKIELPVSIANAYSYDALFQDDGSWNMQLGLGNKVQFDFMKAREVELYKSSYLKAQKESGKKLLLEACLSGKMKLNPIAQENDKFGFANVEFNGMKISNREPYFELKNLKWDDEMKVKKFPVSIKDIEAGTQLKDLSLAFKTVVHFGSEQDWNFGGELGMDVHSFLDKVNGKQQWKFKDFNVNDVAVDFSNSFLTFKGYAKILNKDPVYGDGFQGGVKLGIVPLNFACEANVMFGHTDFRYWYADVMATLGPTGIPVFPGFKISGLGGGAYQKMRFEESEKSPNKSGLSYVPDPNSSLGLKASVLLATGDEKTFNAELTLEMLFNKNGGLDNISLCGAGKLMSNDFEGIMRFSRKVEQLASKIQPSLEDQRRAVANEAAISAQVDLRMDVANKRFTANCDAFMSLGVIRGSGHNDKLGSIGMSFGGNDGRWYIKAGEPAYPLGVKAKIGPVEAFLNSYFMTGSHLPSFPAMPQKVASLLGHSSCEKPDMRQLEKGAGFAFGSQFNLKTGTIPYSILYGTFDAELGFDIMMKQYLNTLCAESGTQPGMNGWYAQGQAYAYLMADVGIRLKLFGSKRNFSVLKGEVGALLKAGFPNPSSFYGGFGVNVSILNGIYKGYLRMEFDLGESCTMDKQGFADGAQIIADMQPAADAKGVDVFSIPQAAFNLPMETEINEEFDNEAKTMKLKLDQYELWYGGTKLEGKFHWNEEKRIVEFQSHDILPANAKLDYRLAIKAKEKRGASWTDLKDENGTAYKEEKRYSFTTGNAPDSIPWSNVKYCYPTRNQQYFLPKEHKTGFVYLHSGMPSLLASEDYAKRVYFVSKTDTISAAFTYNRAENRIMWYFPNGFKPQTEYEALFVMQYNGKTAVPVSGTPAAAMNVAAQKTDITLYEGADGKLQHQSIKLGKASMLGSDKDKLVLRYKFATSRFETFSEKIARITLTNTYRTPIIYADNNGGYYVNAPDVHYLQADMKAAEAFDEAERSGTPSGGNRALIQANADLGTENYYKNFIHPLVYAEYPYHNTVKFERTATHPQIIPDWAVYNSEFYQEKENMHFPWIYAQPLQYKEDFDQVLIGVANAGIRALPYHHQWLNKNFIPIKKGNYPIELHYVLPDGTQTSVQRVVFTNKWE